MDVRHVAGLVRVDPARSDGGGGGAVGGGGGGGDGGGGGGGRRGGGLWWCGVVGAGEVEVMMVVVG